MFCNILSKDVYLFSEELYHGLRGDPFSNKPKNISLETKGIYLVVFRMLKKDISNILVYNYIYYNPLFFDCLLVYFMSNREDSLAYNEFGNFITMVDMLMSSRYGRYNNYEKACINYNNEISNSLVNEELLDNYRIILDMLFKFVLCGNIDRIANVIDLCCKREYIDFIKEMVKDVENYKLFEKKFKTVKSYDYKDLNLLKGCVFVVNDIKSIIYELENKGYTVNQGIQK
jgi:hypothetical protein